MKMYRCSQCDYATTMKLGKCPDCGAFGSFELVPWTDKTTKKSSPAKILQKTTVESERWKKLVSETGETQTVQYFYPCSDTTYHRIFSWGIKQWWVYLLGGEPWIGKSTLILQIMQQLPQGVSVSYFSGEEQANEIVRRSERVQTTLQNMAVYHTMSLEDIIATAEENMPQVMVIDSIQTISSRYYDWVAWSPGQIKVCADALIAFSRANNITLFCLWHVTKWGEIAWPKYLEHIVDVVCYMDGDRFWSYRTLRVTKNRFWWTDDAIVFAMTWQWLQIVWHDFRLHDDQQSHEWRVLTVWLENGRPILVYVEALLTKNYNNHPQRNSLWIDPKRLQLIVAILEKYCKCRLFQYDIFVNIPGEFVFYDSGIDLAIAAAIYSQYKNIVYDAAHVYLWEIGLSGQIVKPKAYEKRAWVVDGWLELIESVWLRVSQILTGE